MKNDIRSRIVGHRKVKASELVPHELNPRVHSENQRDALRALYEKIGFARSLLAYQLPDGRLKLIDGHLRQSMDPDMEVDVEVLDVNDEEARALLLSIDPLAQLADYDNQMLEELRSMTETDNETLGALWASLSRQDEATKQALERQTKSRTQSIPENFIVAIECQNEREQVNLLRRFKKEGLKCRAMTS
jgi:hypothetical protein